MFLRKEKIEKKIRRTYQFRLSKDSEGNPKKCYKETVSKTVLKKTKKKYFRSWMNSPISFIQNFETSRI